MDSKVETQSTSPFSSCWKTNRM